MGSSLKNIEIREPNGCGSNFIDSLSFKECKPDKELNLALLYNNEYENDGSLVFPGCNAC